MKNEPAFPVPMIKTGKCYMDVDLKGMTMRQWYKGQAVIGILSNSETFKFKNDNDVALFAATVADALLAEDAAREATNGE